MNYKVLGSFGKNNGVFIVAMPPTTPLNDSNYSAYSLVKLCQNSALQCQNSVLYYAKLVKQHRSATMLGSIFGLAFFIVIIGALLMVFWVALVTVLVGVGAVGYIETHETIYLAPLFTGILISLMAR